MPHANLTLVIKEFFRCLYHHAWVRVLLSILIVIGIPFFGFYARFIEPRRLHITHQRIPLNKAVEKGYTLRVAQISDLHLGPSNSNRDFFQRAVARIQQLNPDIILLTGDFMQWDDVYARPLAQVLGALQAPLGVWASLGNHDYGVCHQTEAAHDPVDYQKVIQAFTDQGIPVLHNEYHEFKKAALPIRLVGLGDYWTQHFRPHSELFGNLGEQGITLLMSHNPDSIEALQDYHFDLMFAGHVHGGQISFPIIGPLSVPVKHRHLRRGLHRFGNRLLFTSRGLGQTFQLRFNSPPEIVCIDLEILPSPTLPYAGDPSLRSG